MPTYTTHPCCSRWDWHSNKLMLIRRTLKFSILLVSMPWWSWWLIKSFAAPGWSSFETCPDPAGTIYFYFWKKKKKKIASKFFALVQEDYKSLLRRRTLQTFCHEDFDWMRLQRRRRCTSHHLMLTSDPSAGRNWPNHVLWRSTKKIKNCFHVGGSALQRPPNGWLLIQSLQSPQTTMIITD